MNSDTASPSKRRKLVDMPDTNSDDSGDHCHKRQSPVAKKVSLYQGDRFIPTRANLNTDLARHLLSLETPQDEDEDELDYAKFAYRRTLRSVMFDSEHQQQPPTILSFQGTQRVPVNKFDNRLSFLYGANYWPLNPPFIQRAPAIGTYLKALDAPNLVDDFYLNLLDWNANNLLVVALDNEVHSYNVQTGTPDLLSTLAEGEFTSVACSPSVTSNDLIVGTVTGRVCLWDITTAKEVRRYKNHMDRVSSLAWQSGDTCFSSAGRDWTIHHHDTRCDGDEPVLSFYQGHTQEVCGLKWSPDGKYLASGGNDNLLNVWDPALPERDPIQCYKQHNAAIRAIAWCPWKSNLLASGGGSACRQIKFWNTALPLGSSELASFNTGSQVCSLLWSKTSKELLSSHGNTDNCLCVWKYPSMKKVGKFIGHIDRVLSTAMSPDGTCVASLSSDETIRFWKIFNTRTPLPVPSSSSPTPSHRRRHSPSLSSNRAQIR